MKKEKVPEPKPIRITREVFEEMQEIQRQARIAREKPPSYKAIITDVWERAKRRPSPSGTYGKSIRCAICGIESIAGCDHISVAAEKTLILSKKTDCPPNVLAVKFSSTEAARLGSLIEKAMRVADPIWREMRDSVFTQLRLLAKEARSEKRKGDTDAAAGG